MKAGANLDRNNLDCLRLVLALIVVLYHIYALTGIAAFSIFGTYLSAHFAVRSFFVISGLLIYRSYTRSSSAGSYFEKRARRIYPAYFAVVVFTAFALFVLSPLPASRYFGLGFWKYITANLSFLHFFSTALPGVFTSNLDRAVNGPLWTLRIEVAFYLFVPCLHFLCVRFGARRVIGIVFGFSCIWKFGFELLGAHSSNAAQTAAGAESFYGMMASQFPAQLIYFMAGIILFLYFDRLKSHFRAIACITLCLFFLDQWLTRGILDVLWISGVVLVFGFWRYFGNFSRFGDFSYGAYIVHWPILQVLVALGLKRLSPLSFFLLCLALVGLASVLLWHLVEKRFLKTGSHYRLGSSSPQER